MGWSSSVLAGCVWVVAVPCVLGAQEAPEGLADYRRVFVSSEKGSGDFDTWAAATAGLHGLAAADSICQNLASLAPLPNPSSYRAWLSDAANDAWCRVQGLAGERGGDCGGAPLPGGGPWARVDSDLAWSADLAGLTGPQRVFLPAWIDEHGDPIPDGFAYWTSSFSNGVAYEGGGHTFCGGWDDATSGSALTGSAVHLAGTWSISIAAMCTTPLRLLCFETGTGNAPPMGPGVPGGILFLSASTGNGQFSTWALAGGQTGLAAGDAICRAEATAAGLPEPGGFLAVAYDGTAAPLARLPAIPWNRVDGYRVADTTAALAAGNLRTAPNQDPAGTFRPSTSGEALSSTWTGLAPGGGASANHCSSWGTITGDGATGQPNAASDAALAYTTRSCSATVQARLLCASGRDYLHWDSFELQTLARWSAVVGGS